MGEMADAQIDDLIQCIIEGGECEVCGGVHDPQGQACQDEEDDDDGTDRIQVSD
jgi:hypothetical protein